MHVTLNNDADAQTIVSPSMTLPDPLGAHENISISIISFEKKKILECLTKSDIVGISEEIMYKFRGFLYFFYCMYMILRAHNIIFAPCLQLKDAEFQSLNSSGPQTTERNETQITKVSPPGAVSSPQNKPAHCFLPVLQYFLF